MCIIAVAKSVEAKNIRERIPFYQPLAFQNSDAGSAYYPSCALNCPYINKDRYMFKGFTTEWCPIGEMPDENLICRKPEEVDLKCTEHYRGSCLQCFDEERGIYMPHEAEYYLEDEEFNVDN